MSAIFGVIQKDDSPVDTALVERMRESLDNWGGMRSDVWKSADGSAVLGHFLSEETPESAFENQPIERDRFVFVTDARVDNRAELIAELDLRAPDGVEKIPDGELVFQAWQKWGERCVDRLVGAFAFAVWDGEKRELFCARDHIGLRPFFIHDAGDRFIFATDIAAVLESGTVDGEALDEEFLLLMFMQLSVPEMRGRTPFRDVARLTPGHAVRVIPGMKCDVEKYWPPKNSPNLNPRTTEELGEMFGQKLEAALDAAVRSVGGVAAHVSGGLDSSALAALVVDWGHPVEHAFSWSPPFSTHPRMKDDERDRVGAVCRRWELECHFTRIEPDWFDEFKRGRDFCREPRFMWLHEVPGCREARELGIGVMISGWGGDECVTLPGGPVVFWEWLARGRWGILLQEARVWTKKNGGSFFPNLARLAVVNPLRKSWRHLRGRIPRNPVIERRLKMLSPEERKVYLRHEREASRPQSSVRGEMRHRLDRGNIAVRLESWAQLEAREGGVSHRYPLLDRRVLDFMLGLDSRWQYHEALDRFPLIYLCRDLLPLEVVDGKKPQEVATVDAMLQIDTLRGQEKANLNPLIEKWFQRMRTERKQVDNPPETRSYP